MANDWLLNLPPLRAVVTAHGLMPDKKLGQNFLFDLNITSKIARAASPVAGRHVLEIGPGPGGLTRGILAENPASLHVIEKDERCIAAIEDIQAYCRDTLFIHHEDALKFDESKLVKDGQKLKIIANLPYNIGTELLFKWLDKLHLFEDFTIMLQKEVAERITAKPRTAAYGKLSVMSQWKCETETMFHLPPDVFFPPPKVTSSVIRLVPRAEVSHPAPEPELRRVLAAGFNQRRKMLRASLKGLVKDSVAYLEEQGVAPTARPEELSIAEFCKLACALPNHEIRP